MIFGRIHWLTLIALLVAGLILVPILSVLSNVFEPGQGMIRDVTGWSFRDYWFPNIRSIEGAILIFSATLMPYTYLLSRTAFLEQSVRVLEVASTLGRGPWRAFLTVGLPLARPAIVAGTALALMETLADFGTVSHFGINTFTTGIYRTWTSMGDPVAAAQLSSLLVGFVFALLLMERYSRRRARFYQTNATYQTLRPYRLQGGRAWAATLFCAVPVVVGFIAPFLILSWMAFTDGHNLLSDRYLTLTWNSVTLALIAAILAVILAVLLSYAMRVSKSKLAKGAVIVSGLGYAIPGSIVAVGILIPLAGLDNMISAWSEATFGVKTGLIFSGGIAALIFAYLVRFLAVSLQTVQSSFTKVTPRMDDAARSLGQGPLGTVVKVHLPIVTGGMLTAGLIVFVDVMKELPATLIIRPFNFDTLAIQAHNLASDERLTEAATPSLVILPCGLIPVLVLSRAIMRSRPGTRKTAAKRQPQPAE